jgi:hypothetical protein
VGDGKSAQLGALHTVAAIKGKESDWQAMFYTSNFN